MSALIEREDGTVVVTVRLTLKPGRDDILISLVRSAPTRMLAPLIREAMRSGVKPQFEPVDQVGQVYQLELPDISLDL